MGQLSLVGVSKAFGARLVVDNVSLDVPKGSVLTLLGPSGCGKTTILRMVAGFATPTAGAIHLAGKDITRLAPNVRETGLLFQNYALFPHMRVRDNVAFGLRMRRLPRETIRKKVEDALALVQLESFADHYPSQLSGGQQQRAALARVLVIEPQGLLLDEPFGALDRNLREQMQIEFRKLQNRLGITTLFVTHDQDEAFVLSDQVAVMRDGRVEQFGTPLDVFRQPRTRFVARFMGISNLLPGTVVGPTPTGCAVLLAPGVTVECSGPKAPVGARVHVAVRADAITLRENPSPATPTLPGLVTFVTNFASKVAYEIRLGEGPTVSAEASLLERGRVHSAGEKVFLELRAEHCILLED